MRVYKFEAGVVILYTTVLDDIFRVIKLAKDGSNFNIEVLNVSEDEFKELPYWKKI